MKSFGQRHRFTIDVDHTAHVVRPTSIPSVNNVVYGHKNVRSISSIK